MADCVGLTAGATVIMGYELAQATFPDGFGGVGSAAPG